MFRLGVDYGVGRAHAPGIGRYVREVVRALAALDDGPELRLLDAGREPDAVDERALGIASPRVRRLRLRVPRGALRAAAVVGLTPDRMLGGCDAFLQARLPALPKASCPEAIAFAELPPAGTDLARFRRIVVFSADSRAKLIAAGSDASRVVQLDVGADHWARDLATMPPRRDPPQVLVLGAPRPQRFPCEVLAACEAAAARRELTLVFAGSRAGADPAFVAALAKSPLRERVEWRLPSERELPRLVAESTALAHLTADEGTAVTPLEALAVGVPPIVSRIPAFEEAAARFPITLIDDRDALVAALERVLDERPVLRATVPTWSDHAASLMRSLEV